MAALSCSVMFSRNQLQQSACIAGNFWQRKLSQIKKCDFCGETFADCSLLLRQSTPWPQISRRKLLRIATKPWNSRKFSPSKVSRYTVVCELPKNFTHVQTVQIYPFLCLRTSQRMSQSYVRYHSFDIWLSVNCHCAPLCRSTNEMHTFVWQLLKVVASEERLDLRRHLKRAIEFWSRQGKLTPALVKAVCSHTESKEHLQVKCL